MAIGNKGFNVSEVSRFESYGKLALKLCNLETLKPGVSDAD
jgi:hypothetical protein